MRMRLGRRGVLAAVALVCGLVLPSPSSGKNKQVDTWNARIQETVQLLHAGNAQEARATIDPVVAEMTREIDPGKQAGHAVALALMLRALAEAAGGDERGAAWDWQVAQQLDPSIESWDLHEFGAAGEVLARHRLSADPVPAMPTLKELEEAGASQPKVLDRGGQPAYLENARKRHWSGAITVAVVIDAAGFASYPRVLRASHEVGMVLATCEYIRGITFGPAQRDGQPIPAMYSVVMNFTLD